MGSNLDQFLSSKAKTILINSSDREKADKHHGAFHYKRKMLKFTILPKRIKFITPLKEAIGKLKQFQFKSKNMSMLGDC